MAGPWEDYQVTPMKQTPSGPWEEFQVEPSKVKKGSLLNKLAQGFVSDIGSLLGPEPEEVVNQFEERQKQGIGAATKPIVEAITHPQNIPGQIAETAIEHPLITGMNLLPFAKVPKSIGEAALKSTIPERIYGSAIKLGLDPYVLEKKGVNEAMAQRMESLRTGVEARASRNVKGAAKAEALEKETHEAIDATISSAKEKGTPVDLEAITDKALQSAYTNAKKVFPTRGEKIIKSFRDEFLQVDPETGVAKRKFVSPEEAESIKRELWTLGKFSSQATPTGISARLNRLMTRGIGHEIDVELEQRFPVLKSLDPQDAARINLRNRIYDIVQEKLEGRERGMHGAAILHPSKLGWYASLQAGALGRFKESLAFALDSARKSVGQFTERVRPEVLGAEEQIVEGTIVPQKLLKPGQYNMPGTVGTPGVTPIQKMTKGLIPESIPLRYPPQTTQFPLAGERAAEPTLSGRPESATLPKSGGAFSSTYHPSPDRLESALRKPPFMRTAEDQLLIQEAQKIDPKVGVTSPTPIKRRTDVVEGEAFVPKDKIKFGSKGGVIGRPRKTESDIATAIEEESKPHQRKSRKVEPSE